MNMEKTVSLIFMEQIARKSLLTEKQDLLNW